MLSGTELVIILILALLLLGPQELPKVAKTLGKTMRELQKATTDLKSVVETEFAKMEHDINQSGEPNPNSIAPPAVAPVAAAALPPLTAVPSSEAPVASAVPGSDVPATPGADKPGSSA